MSQGTLTLFNHTAELIAAGKLGDITAASFKLAMVNAIPAKTAPDPRWAAGGGTNLSSGEVSGDGYTAGGNACANPTVTRTAGVATFDLDDPTTWPKDAAGPTNIKAGILYLSSHANKHALGFYDLTTDGATAISMVDASIPVQLPSIFALTANAA